VNDKMSPEEKCAWDMRLADAAIRCQEKSIDKLDKEISQLKQQLQVASELLVECKAYVVWHKYGNAVDGEDYSDQLELQKSVDAFLKQINPTRE